MVCMYSLKEAKSIRIGSSKISCLFQHKNLLFLFYTNTFQNTPHHIIYFTLQFIKIIFFQNSLVYNKIGRSTLRSIFLAIQIITKCPTIFSMAKKMVVERLHRVQVCLNLLWLWIYVNVVLNKLMKFLGLYHVK